MAMKTYLADPRQLIFVMLQITNLAQDSPKTEGPHTTKERGFDVYSVTTLDHQNIHQIIDAMELHYDKVSEAGLFELHIDLIFYRSVAKARLENVASHDSEELSDFIVACSVKREWDIPDTTPGRNRQWSFFPDLPLMHGGL
ncbi:hypothetical protein H9Q72_009337 [Fusarium xylarioides]|uniref:Uncharacterized protein n=1 Tax=Fusarium xylarioides TaxID=221167 RepID=A0A9P7HMB6_9HYPO|nr:hypothetical protein H9Q70_006142 [Fusarium xylarioides]KAG5762555.1 hypothetical protein H9Q72_009337 [Fusarium xylarioides]KAG5781772.1 hypothetical protein H9Q73_004591 [Fusarium xylarioides]